MHLLFESQSQCTITSCGTQIDTIHSGVFNQFQAQIIDCTFVSLLLLVNWGSFEAEKDKFPFQKKKFLFVQGKQGIQGLFVLIQLKFRQISYSRGISVQNQAFQQVILLVIRSNYREFLEISQLLLEIIGVHLSLRVHSLVKMGSYQYHISLFSNLKKEFLFQRKIPLYTNLGSLVYRKIPKFLFWSWDWGQ